MSTVDFSNAQGFDMTDSDPVRFGTLETSTSTNWSWLTPSGNDIELHGTGLRYNAQGRAIAGTIKSIEIDVGNDDFGAPDVKITGIKADARSFDAGASGFWRFMSGNDTIIGPNANATGASLYSALFGDALTARNKATGGNDTFNLGTGSVWASGDVWTVGSLTKGAVTVQYKGGDDLFTGVPMDDYLKLAGDAQDVLAASLIGGDDRIYVSAGDISHFTGDAFTVEGIAGKVARVIGGDDMITGASASARALIVGDVEQQRNYSFVRGGDDTLTAGDAPADIVGDVVDVGNNRMIGGHDKIWGSDFADDLYGDFHEIGVNGKVTGGDDVIYGGRGNDSIYGDGVADDARLIGGDDRLFGDIGEDNIYGGSGNDLIAGGRDDDFLQGNSGNDLIDGGHGRDFMDGGAGDDIYVVDSADDTVYERPSEGTDTVRTVLTIYALGDEVENLTFTGRGSFNGFGNTLGNVIKGGAGMDTIIGLVGDDRIFGGGGSDSIYGDVDNDTLNGGAGGDLIDGGAGFDIASYAGSERAVKVALDGSLTVTGDAFGDILNEIEGLEGTSFGDTLYGNGAMNLIIGGAGNDLLKGQAGADRLNGGIGRDELYGGSEADSFVFNAMPGSANADRIMDFDATLDTIEIQNSVFRGIGAEGALKASAFKLSTQAKDANDRIVYDEATGKLYFDRDGSGSAAAVHFATLDGKPTITFADFVVI